MNPLDLLPPQLTESPHWVLWRQETKPDETRPRKVPYVAQDGPRRRASSTDPATWRTYAAARAVYEADPSQWAGLGFVFAQGAGFCGIDLDGCRDPRSGELAPWAEELVKQFATYSEVSPSGTGVKLFVHGTVPAGRNVKLGPVVDGRAPGIEVYGEGRFFTVTGQRLPDMPHIVAEGQADLDWLWQKYFAKAEPTAAPRPAVPPSADRAAVVERAARYVGTIPGAVEGANGSGTTFKVAQHLAVGFGLTEGEAAPILRDYNATCVPPWSDHDLMRKFREARDKSRCKPGYFLRDDAPQRWVAEHDADGAWASSTRNGKSAATETTVVVRLSDVQPEPVAWLWPGRIAIGKLTIISGDPGLGKSFLTLDLAARISNGSPWPDDPSTHAPLGSVVLLSAEDDLADTIRPRLDAAGADVSKIVALAAIKCQDELGNWERSFDLSRDVERLETEVIKLADCRAIFVDPISCYLGKTKSHDNAEVRSVLAPLAKMAARLNVAVVAVSHLRKGEGQALYRTMGSLAFVAAARTAWAVTRDKDDPTDQRRLFLPLKNNLGPDQTGLAFSLVPADGQTYIAWEPGPVTIKADDALAPPDGRGRKPRDLDEAKTFLVTALADGPRLRTELAEEAKEQHGIADRTLKRAKKELGVESFRETVPGPWLWLLPGATITAAQGSQNAILADSGPLGPLARNTGKTADLEGEKPKGAKLFESRKNDPLDDLNALFAEIADIELEAIR